MERLEIQRVARAFERARAAPVEDIDRVLKAACEGDSVLEREVRDLLVELVRHRTVMEEPSETAAKVNVASLEPAHAAHPLPTFKVIEESVGDCVGEYVLEQLLGQGSVGSVWLARNPALPQQAVAIKIVRPGMDSRIVVARFQHEMQVLAEMDHPGIARVLGAGVTSLGRPYFVMEYVDGLPITQQCDNQRLSLHDRCAVLAAVCDAVQYAHRKGIIHRDLKPSNILVAMNGSTPTVKVIDFGIAKAMEPREDAALTLTQSMPLGTLAYMSPEQAMHPSRVDTRTDVYALGVVLYELLCGFTPHQFDAEQEKFVEAADRARREEVTRPSLAVSRRHSGSMNQVASLRGIAPARLARALRGELDWVAGRALALDPDRRYAAPADLARDLQAMRDGRAVIAAPPSLWYHTRAFARRHRAALIGAGVVLTTLLFASAVLGAVLQRSRAQRDALEKRIEESSYSAMLLAESLVPSITMHQRLADATLTAEHDRSDARRPLLIDASREAHRAALRDRVIAIAQGTHPDEPFGHALILRAGSIAAESMRDFGLSYELGDRACAVAAHVKNNRTPLLLSLAQRARARQRLGDFEGALAEYVLVRAQLDPHSTHSVHLDTLQQHIGTCLTELGRYDEAEMVYASLRQKTDSSVQKPIQSMTVTLRALQGNSDEAVRTGKAEWEQSIAEAMPLETQLQRLNRYALAVERAGCVDESGSLYESAMSQAITQLGYAHPTTDALIHGLARARIAQGRKTEAIVLLERVDKWRAGVAPCHPLAIQAAIELAEQLAATEETQRARAKLEEALSRTIVYNHRINRDLAARAERGLAALHAPSAP
jgi:serine/threonine protein kinase